MYPIALGQDRRRHESLRAEETRAAFTGMIPFRPAAASGETLFHLTGVNRALESFRRVSSPSRSLFETRRTKLTPRR